MRQRWKWIVLIGAMAVAVGVALWLSAGEPRVNTRLSLSPKRPEIVKDRDGKTNQPHVWVFEVLLHSDRLLETISTNYSIEAHTAAGSTNYDLPFRDDVRNWRRGLGPFQTVGSLMCFGEPFPFLVLMPIDADAFRVKIEIKEFGAAYSRLEMWASVGSGRKLDQRLRSLILNRRQRGEVTTAWSPWMVRSNNAWMEKVER